MKRSGFSLVELSVVLAILGLIIGGILGGNALLRASELRAITTEYGRYRNAVGGFRDKFQAIPGDMINAAQIWGIAGTSTTGSDTACYNANQLNGIVTCNGNGNGIVDPYSSSPGNGGNSGAQEQYMFWKHLANAGLIEGQYSGVADTGTNFSAVIGTNVPKSASCRGCGWSTTLNYANILYGPFAGVSNTFFARDAGYGNNLIFGKNTTNRNTYAKALSPRNAHDIDRKVDDGMPGTGRWLGTWTSTCASGDGTDLTVEYNLSAESMECSLIVVDAF